MANEVSESIFKPLSNPLSGKPPSFSTLCACFIALLMSFFIMKKAHFMPLWALKHITISAPINPLSLTRNTLAHRPLNHLVDSEFKPCAALLDLCKITHIDLDNNPSLEDIVQETQKHWLRQPGTERHQLMHGSYDTHKKQIIPLLKRLNVIGDSRAKYTDQPYDIVLVHGATADAMITRIQCLIDEYHRGVRFKKIILLSGDRPLDAKQEAEYIQLGLKTEAEMFQYLWKAMPGLPDSVKQDFYLVNTKGTIVKDRYKRPTTRDTIYGWLNEIPPQANSRCLAISHQPFVPFQDFVFYNTLKEKLGAVHLETIGESANPDEPISVHLDNLARCLYELQLDKRLRSYHHS